MSVLDTRTEPGSTYALSVLDTRTEPGSTIRYHRARSTIRGVSTGTWCSACVGRYRGSLPLSLSQCLARDGLRRRTTGRHCARSVLTVSDGDDDDDGAASVTARAHAAESDPMSKMCATSTNLQRDMCAIWDGEPKRWMMMMIQGSGGCWYMPVREKRERRRRDKEEER
eukprot:1064269-Rhodomonas_salina.1